MVEVNRISTCWLYEKKNGEAKEQKQLKSKEIEKIYPSRLKSKCIKVSDLKFYKFHSSDVNHL